MTENNEKIDRKAKREAKRKQKLLKNAARDVRRMMLKYCQDERFAEPMAAALPLYWDSFYDINTADEMSQNEALRFYDWFIFDFQPETGDRLIEQFAADRTESLNENQKEVVDAWLSAPAAAAYEFVDFDEMHSRFKLKDFVSGEELIVFSGAGKGMAEKGDLILNRVTPVGDELVFSTVGAFIPEDEITDLADKLAAAQKADAESYPDATHDEFMRRNGQVIVHHALSEAVKNDRFAVTRLNPERVDLAARRTVKKVVKKIRRR